MDDAGVNRLPPRSKTSSDGTEPLAQTIRRIDAVLPQTQCTRCGYPACLDYAQAIAENKANINQCPPGGSATINTLSEITGRPYAALNPANGTEKPREVARIDESRCIGCRLCIDACPVDAIVGGIKRMHTVIAADCTGCELCVAPCPVDCIQMVPTHPAPLAWTAADAAQARQRYLARAARLSWLAAQKSGQVRTPDLRSTLARAKARARSRAGNES